MTVKEARRGLARVGWTGEARASDDAPPHGEVAPRRGYFAARSARRSAVLSVENVWLELRDGPAILRGVTLHAHAGEAIALMGRNGAGKSTLLKVIAGLLDATRGRVKTPATALLTQHPGDHLMHDTIGADVPGSELAHRHPKDVSGGERQRQRARADARRRRPRCCCSTSRRAGWTRRAATRSPHGSRSAPA